MPQDPMTRGVPAAMRLLGLGWYFAVCVIGGVFGGYLLDGWLDTKPLFTMLGLFGGLALACYGGYKLLMQVISKRGQGEG